MDLTRSVNADRRHDPARLTIGHQGTKVARTEALWHTRSSRMGRHYFLSNNFRGDCRNCRPIRWVGKDKVFWGLRGFSFKAPSISLPWGAKPSVDASSLTTPLTSSSAYSVASLLFRNSSPLRASYLIFGVICTAGRSILFINQATCCLTSFQSETCLTPIDSPRHPKPQ